MPQAEASDYPRKVSLEVIGNRTYHSLGFLPSVGSALTNTLKELPVAFMKPQQRESKSSRFHVIYT